MLMVLHVQAQQLVALQIAIQLIQMNANLIAMLQDHLLLIIMLTVASAHLVVNALQEIVLQIHVRQLVQEPVLQMDAHVKQMEIVVLVNVLIMFVNLLVDYLVLQKAVIAQLTVNANLAIVMETYVSQHASIKQQANLVQGASVIQIMIANYKQIVILMFVSQTVEELLDQKMHAPAPQTLIVLLVIVIHQTLVIIHALQMEELVLMILDAHALQEQTVWLELAPHRPVHQIAQLEQKEVQLILAPVMKIPTVQVVIVKIMFVLILAQLSQLDYYLQVVLVKLLLIVHQTSALLMFAFQIAQQL